LLHSIKANIYKQIFLRLDYYFLSITEGKMDIALKNFKIGVAAIIACYFAFAFYILTLFFSIEVFGKDNMLYSYILAGFLAAFVLAAGILFLVSLVFNIRQSKAAHKLSKGLTLTLIGIPPIALCYLAFAIKALTE
jgi:nitric oxide reductase large subunit